MISYAQNFEDVMLNRVFRDKPKGFYIDVGSHDPAEMSVTKYFYDLGWHGINIEPVPESYQRFVEQRPRDTNLNLAIGERYEIRTLYVVEGSNPTCPNAAAFSAFDQRIAAGGAHTAGDHPLREIKVEVRTLAEICRHYGREPIDFLKIDVNGWERQVIAGADFAQFHLSRLAVNRKLRNRGVKFVVSKTVTFRYVITGTYTQQQ